MRFFHPLIFVLAVLLPLGAAAEITFLPVSSESAFPEATAPDALRYACAPSADELADFYSAKGLHFVASLARPIEPHNVCHIFYEPSVPGYRALPDNRPVQGLYVAVDPLSFIVRLKPNGDSLSIAKQVLPQIDRPLDVTLSVPGNFNSRLWPDALKFHFGESKHRFQVRKSGSSSSHPWAQDHQKAGEVEGRLRILVPRRLYEGRREDGETFGPMLDKLNDPVFARSNLSWEGGDIQFIMHPKDPSRMVMLHGGVGRYYWGTGLTAPEASYVLMTEFGADLAVDLTPTMLHADYVATMLPVGGVALVSRSVSGDAALFRAAAGVVERLLGQQATPAFVDLKRFLSTWDGDLAASASPLRGLIRGIERSLDSYSYPEDTTLESDLTQYVDEHCGGDAPSCFQGDAKDVMFAIAPDLLRRSSNQSTDIAAFELFITRMLAVMEAQLPREAAPRELALDGTARTLEDLGFRVVRVPYIYSPKLHDAWPGIAYANAFVDGRKIFVPAIGLGELEAEMFAQMQEDVGPAYQVIPVNASFSVLNNGGAHCVFGIVREPLPVKGLSE